MVEQVQSCLVRFGTKQSLFICLEKFSCLSNYLLLPLKKNHAYLTDLQYSIWLLKKYSRLQCLLHSEHL